MEYLTNGWVLAFLSYSAGRIALVRHSAHHVYRELKKDALRFKRMGPTRKTYLLSAEDFAAYAHHFHPVTGRYYDAGLRTVHRFMNLHATIRGSFVEVHADLGNPQCGRIFALMHLILDVIPHGICCLLRRGSFYVPAADLHDVCGCCASSETYTK